MSAIRWNVYFKECLTIINIVSWIPFIKAWSIAQLLKDRVNCLWEKTKTQHSWHMQGQHSVSDPASDLPLERNKQEGKRPRLKLNQISQTVIKREEQPVSVIRAERQKINPAPACSACAYPWIPSPLSLWLKRRLEVWHRLCVNMLCQLWALWASGQPRHHTLLLLPLPPFHTEPLPASASGPFSWLSWILYPSGRQSRRVWHTHVSTSCLSGGGLVSDLEKRLTSCPPQHEAECKHKSWTV